MLKAAKELYPEEAQTLTLYQGQYKTKEDQYQRRTQAVERLLFKYSRFSINQLIGLVTADNYIQEKYLKLDCYKYTRSLRSKPLLEAQQYQAIQATKTTTSYLSVGGTSTIIASRQSKKRKRTIQPGTTDEPTAITKEVVVEEEEDNDNSPVTPAINGTNTRRASIVLLLLTPKEKKVSSAELLSKSIERAATIAIEARLVPKR